MLIRVSLWTVADMLILVILVYLYTYMYFIQGQLKSDKWATELELFIEWRVLAMP